MYMRLGMVVSGILDIRGNTHVEGYSEYDHAINGVPLACGRVTATPWEWEICPTWKLVVHCNYVKEMNKWIICLLSIC